MQAARGCGAGVGEDCELLVGVAECAVGECVSQGSGEVGAVEFGGVVGRGYVECGSVGGV